MCCILIFPWRWLERHEKKSSDESGSWESWSIESAGYSDTYSTLDALSPVILKPTAASTAAPASLKPEASDVYLVSPSGKRRIDKPAMIDISNDSSQHSGHQDPRCWLLPDLARVEAERRLCNKLDGTFLIRRSSSESAPYTLSIVDRGMEKGVGHILIRHSKRGYGFAEPHLDFPTLNDLVHYYTTHSLEEHNPQLRTTLVHPILALQSGPSEDHYVVNDWYPSSLFILLKLEQPKEEEASFVFVLYYIQIVLWLRQLKLCEAILCGYLWYLFRDWKFCDCRWKPNINNNNIKQHQFKKENQLRGRRSTSPQISSRDPLTTTILLFLY